MSTVRLNVNVDSNLYHEFKSLAQVRGKTITDYVEEWIKEEVRRVRYESMRIEFDSLADEPATKEMLEVDKECSSDGL